MNGEDETWRRIKDELQKYKDRQLEHYLDYQKFYLYSLVTHSTAIEGSTLTELETQILFDDGLTAKNKPLVFHLMNQDLKDAYGFAMKKAEEKAPLSVGFLQELNARLMKSTGSVYSLAGGVFDSSKGEFRLCNVRAGFGGDSYINYTKIPDKVSELCKELQNKLGAIPNSDIILLYNLSFDAHLQLVLIHPWVDGNGRTARLLMNYIQFEHGLFPVKVHSEDREEYICSLLESREHGSSAPFLNFMKSQLLKSIMGVNGNSQFTSHKR